MVIKLDKRKKTRMMRLPSQEISLTISLAVWIQYPKVTNGRTDGHWPIAIAALTRGNKL